MSFDPSEFIYSFSAQSPGRLHENIIRVATTALPPPFKNGRHRTQDGEQLSSSSLYVPVSQVRPRKRSLGASGVVLLTDNGPVEHCRPVKRYRAASNAIGTFEQRAMSVLEINPSFEPSSESQGHVTMRRQTYPALLDPLTTKYEAVGAFTPEARPSQLYASYNTSIPADLTWASPPTVSSLETTVSASQAYPGHLESHPILPSNRTVLPKASQWPKRARKTTNVEPPSRPPSNTIYTNGTSSIPANILDIVKAIKSIDRKATYPAPTALRKVEGMNQRNGFLTKHSPLMPWYGDTRLFEEKWWKYLYVGGKSRQKLLKEMGDSGEPPVVRQVSSLKKGKGKVVADQESKENLKACPRLHDQRWAAADSRVEVEEGVAC